MLESLACHLHKAIAAPMTHVSHSCSFSFTQVLHHMAHISHICCSFMQELCHMMHVSQLLCSFKVGMQPMIFCLLLACTKQLSTRCPCDAHVQEVHLGLGAMTEDRNVTVLRQSMTPWRFQGIDKKHGHTSVCVVPACYRQKGRKTSQQWAPEEPLGGHHTSLRCAQTMGGCATQH